VCQTANRPRSRGSEPERLKGDVGHAREVGAEQVALAIEAEPDHAQLREVPVQIVPLDRLAERLDLFAEDDHQVEREEAG
jgi:hypothetical protein